MLHTKHIEKTPDVSVNIRVSQTWVHMYQPLILSSCAPYMDKKDFKLQYNFNTIFKQMFKGRQPQQKGSIHLYQISHILYIIKHTFIHKYNISFSTHETI